MKLSLLITVTMAGLLGGIFGAEPEAYPTIVVDDAHLQFKRPDGKESAMYDLPATHGVVLDVSGYKFQIPAQYKVEAPDTVMIVIGRDRQYSGEWKPRDGKLTLDAASLKPLSGAEPFTGFQSGDSVVIGIGHGTVRGGTLQFALIWVGMANIK